MTVEIFEIAKEHGDVAEIYDANECKKIVDTEVLLELREDHWLEEVYGAQSRLDNDQWLQKVQAGGSGLLKPDELR